MTQDISAPNWTKLFDRSILEIAGTDRCSFLQGLITNNVEKLKVNEACFAGFLSPQGKILFEFFVVGQQEVLLIECNAAIASDLRKKLGFYILRAQVKISDISARYDFYAYWGDEVPAVISSAEAIIYTDPRSIKLGKRVISKKEALENREIGSPNDFALETQTQPTATVYDAFRVEHTIPEGGKDYAFGNAFPHEACFDLLHGVDFKKGCYVGQEVVSRMQHRGTARTRIVSLGASMPLEKGAEITADGFPIGFVGTVSGLKAIGLVRIDRAADALANGQTILSNGTPIEISIPEWANYSLPASKI